MRNLSLAAIIAVIVLILLPGAEIQAQSTSAEILTDSAQVIYITRDRVYLSIGTLDGMNTDWQVRIDKTVEDTLVIPLAWCGEDVCYFEFPAQPDSFFTVGDRIGLFYQPNIPRKNYSITLAYPHMPALPHETQVDIYDMEFGDLMATKFMDIKPEFKKDTAGMVGYDFLTIQWNNKIIKSNGEPLYNFDLQFAFEYQLSATNVNAYLIQKKFHYWIRGYSVIFGDGDTARVLFDGNEWKVRLLTKIVNPYILPIHYDEYPTEDMKTGEEIIVKSVDIFTLRDTTLSSYKISTGPYYFENQDNNQITLLRNKYNLSYNGYPDSLIIKIIPDYLERKLAFQMGQIDYLDINYTDKGQFQDDYKIMESETKLGLYLSANSMKDYLDDGILTTALSYFINRESLCRVALGGMAEPLIGPSCLTSTKSTEPYQYDPPKGRELLRRTGDIPKYLSLYIKPDDFITRRTAEYIKGLLARQNIYVTIYSDKDFHPGPTPEQFEEFDLMLSYIDLSSADPLVILNQITFHHGMTDITANKSLYFSGEYDTLVNDYLNDPDTSTAKLLNYYQYLREVPSGIFLLSPQRLTVVSNRLKDFGFKSDGTVDFSRIELSDEPQK